MTGGTDILLASATETPWGWMVGGGLEYGFIGNWSLKVEYDYMDFGRERVNITGASGTWQYDIEQRVHASTWSRAAPTTASALCSGGLPSNCSSMA